MAINELLGATLGLLVIITVNVDAALDVTIVAGNVSVISPRHSDHRGG